MGHGHQGGVHIKLEGPAAGLVAIVIVLLVFGMGCACCLTVLRGMCVCMCCRSSTPASQGGDEVSVEGQNEKVKVLHLQRSKELSTAYLLWWTAGLVGAHHFYLERLVHGALSLWTLNFLFCGWIIDGCLLPAYVYRHNRQVARMALSDGSCSRFWSRMPFGLVVVIISMVVVYLKAPGALHSAGVIDIERWAAETSKNPYLLLGLNQQKNHTLLGIKDAYRVKLKPFEGIRLCNATCKSSKQDLRKAYEYVSLVTTRREAALAQSRPQSKVPEGKERSPVDDMLDQAVLEWQAIGNAIKSKAKDLKGFFASEKGEEDSADSEL